VWDPDLGLTVPEAQHLRTDALRHSGSRTCRRAREATLRLHNRDISHVDLGTIIRNSLRYISNILGEPKSPYRRSRRTALTVCSTCDVPSITYSILFVLFLRLFLSTLEETSILNSPTSCWFLLILLLNTEDRGDIFLRNILLLLLLLLLYYRINIIFCFIYFICNVIFVKFRNVSWPPLWSSGQSSCLPIQRPGFDSRCYQIFSEIVGLERGTLSLASTIEDLLERKSSGSDLENRDYGRRNPSRWPRGTLFPQNLALTSQRSGARSIRILRSRTLELRNGIPIITC
jgi:hypothetical protein